MEKEFCAGVIVKPHGVKGAVLIYPLSDDPDRLKNLKTIRAVGKGKEIHLSPRTLTHQKNMLIMTFEEIKDRDEAESFRDFELMIDRSEAVPLKENEYYAADLIGLRVEDKSGLTGTLKDVFRTGANDVYEVELQDNKSVLIPAIKQCILAVDTENGIMKTDIPEGLL